MKHFAKRQTTLTQRVHVKVLHQDIVQWEAIGAFEGDDFQLTPIFSSGSANRTELVFSVFVIVS